MQQAIVDVKAERSGDISRDPVNLGQSQAGGVSARKISFMRPYKHRMTRMCPTAGLLQNRPPSAVGILLPASAYDRTGHSQAVGSSDGTHLTFTVNEYLTKIRQELFHKEVYHLRRGGCQQFLQG